MIAGERECAERAFGAVVPTYPVDMTQFFRTLKACSCAPRPAAKTAKSGRVAGITVWFMRGATKSVRTIRGGGISWPDGRAIPRYGYQPDDMVDEGLGMDSGGASAEVPEGWCVTPGPAGVREAAASYGIAQMLTITTESVVASFNREISD